MKFHRHSKIENIINFNLNSNYCEKFKMIDQEDVDFINDKLYCLSVPDEAIKKIMFYLSILINVINYKFPENFLNYDHPYFRTCNEMEEFLSLARSFDPEFLYQNNVIIYYNNKKKIQILQV